MMTDFGALMDGIAERAARNLTRAPGDTEKDGILFCGRCGEPKQAWIDWPADADGNVTQKLVRVTCRCDAEREKKEKERLRREQFERNLRDARAALGSKRNFEAYTFASDDTPNSPISKTCRRYIEHWEEMQKDNMGILLYGSKGTGKSFYAGCVANALAERMILTGFISTALLMNTLQNQRERDEIIEAVCRFRLLVLDDLGAERDTSYGAESVYNIINERYNTKRPTIITTNLDLADMQEETDIWRSRIYDRVIEMCPIAIKMDGESRRSGIADRRRQMARMILSGQNLKEEVDA